MPFCRRTIELHGNSTSAHHTLIPQEVLAEHEQAMDILSHAKAQADCLLQQASAQRQALLEQAMLQFWNSATAQLTHWESERKSMSHRLEQTATAIAIQATHRLLEETPPLQRLSSLVKQLLSHQLPAIKATLCCHPLELNDIEQCLALKDNVPWQLRADDSVKPQTLVLETQEGDFRIDWLSMLNTLLACQNADEPAITEE